MLKIPEEQQKACYASGYFRRYSFEFDGFTIGNDKIHSESVIIKEAICEDAELKLGGCIASSCEFEVSETVTDNINLSGLRFKAYLHTYRANTEYNTQDIDNPDQAIGEEVGNPIPMGVYNVRSVEMVDDADYKRVVAYDDIYDWDIDVSEWYNNTVPSNIKIVTYTDTNGNVVDISKGIPSGATRKTTTESVGIPIGTLRALLLRHLMSLNGNTDESKYQQAISKSYMNDEVMATKTLQTDSNNSIKGVELLRYLCELAGGFGRINRYGVFEIVSLGESGGLYPENNVFPEDSKGTDGNLYPEDSFVYLGGGEDDSESPDLVTTHYEEYNASDISCVSFYTYYDVENESGIEEVETGKAKMVSYPENSTANPYISSNPFTLQIPESDLRLVAKNIYDSISGIAYRPNTTTLQGVPYYEPGDYYNVTKKISFESFVFSRTLTGVQGLRDEFLAQGLEARENNASPYENIYASMGDNYESTLESEELEDTIEDNEVTQTSIFEHDSSHFLSVVASSQYAWDDNENRIDEYGFGEPTLSYRNKPIFVTPERDQGRLIVHEDGLPDINYLDDEDFNNLYCDDTTGLIYQPMNYFFNSAIISLMNVPLNFKAWKKIARAQEIYYQKVYDYSTSDVGMTYLDENTGKLYRLTGWNLSSDNPQFRWDFYKQLEKVTVQLETSIEQTSERITLEANKLWSETSRLDTRVDVEAGRVNSLVTKTGNLENGVDTLSSQIEQLPHKISLTTTNGSKTAGITIQLTDEYGRTISSDSDNITLTGVVGFEDLSNNSRTVINGSYIKTGTIDADRINLNTVASKTYNPITFPSSGGIRVGSSGLYTDISYNQITTESIKNISGSYRSMYVDSGDNAGLYLQGKSITIRANNGIGIYRGSGSIYINNMPHGTTDDRFVRISSSGYLYYTTSASTGSSRRYKYDIKPVENIDLNPHKILDIPIKQFKFNNLSELPFEEQNKDVIGMVAEDIAEIYPVATVYRNGQIENWNERYLIPPMLSLIQEMYQKIQILETKII